MRFTQQPLSTLGVIGGISILALAQPAQADVIQIRAVQVNPTSEGIEVILEAESEEQLQVFTSSFDRTFRADIINAQLSLAGGEAFRQENPTDTIAAVTVESLDTNSIRVQVIGTTERPMVTLNQELTGLVLGVTAPTVASEVTEPPDAVTPPVPETEPQPPPPSEEPTDAPEAASESESTDDLTDTDDTVVGDGEAIRLTVTGEAEVDEDSYRAPNATTGTRTDTPIRDIPQSIQVIPQQVLEDQQVTSIEEAVRNVSGITEGNTASNTRDSFVLRGFTASTILRDGFRDLNGLSSRSFIETGNIERIEVLKGPASVLFGNLAPGGAINIVTKTPLSDPFYSGGVSVGSFGFLDSNIDLSGPLDQNGNVLYRLNAVYEDSEGFRGDFNQDVERFFVAPTLSFSFGERTDLLIAVEYLNDERPIDSGIVFLGDEVADIPVDTVLNEPDDFNETEEITARYLLEHRFSDNWTLRNSFRFISTENESFETAPRSLDEDTGILSRRFGQTEDSLRTYDLQTTVTGEFSTGSIDHRLLFGIDLLQQDFDNVVRGSTATVTAPPVDIFDPEIGLVSQPSRDELQIDVDATDTQRRLGIFVQDQITFNDKLKLLIGGRFDAYQQESFLEPGTFPAALTILATGSNELEDTGSAFSPRIGLVYQPIEPVSLYASFSRSFDPNFISSITVDGDTLEPTIATQFEVGAKIELGHNLAANLAFFNLTQENIPARDPDSPPGIINFVVPIGELRSRGFEFDLAGEILPNWRIIASYTFLDSEVTEGLSSVPEGNRFPNTARHSASLWSSYTIPSGSLEGLGFGLGVFFVGERPVNFANSLFLPSYTRTDAAIYYRRDNFNFALNFRNLFDVTYFESVSSNDELQVQPGTPFSVTASLSFTF